MNVYHYSIYSVIFSKSLAKFTSGRCENVSLLPLVGLHLLNVFTISIKPSKSLSSSLSPARFFHSYKAYGTRMAQDVWSMYGTTRMEHVWRKAYGARMAQGVWVMYGVWDMYVRRMGHVWYKTYGVRMAH